MGAPACRISDATAHGGIVILGFPQVLIGDLPASRIGDMHTCPMVTVLVPHVGGPFILGSPTVLVGDMPQSRVGDELVCVGPPDVAVVGEFTVLVGMAGAGGAAGASGGVSAMGVPVPTTPPPAAASDASSDASASSSTTPQAQAQPDGTTKTSAPPGQTLPPVQLKQQGWPNLPPENTATFESVQPATVLPGTTLYASADADATAPGTSYWSADPPTASDASSGSDDAGANGDGSQNADQDPDQGGATHVLVHTVPPGDGIKAWAGQGPATKKLQLWVPPGTIPSDATKRFRQPGRAR